MTAHHTLATDAIAITGLSGRFPGAPSIVQYWNNLRDGVCSLTDFTEEQLLTAGVPATEVRHHSYVATKGWLAKADRFDHTLFGFNRTEAAALDPQHRLLLETAWSALLDSGFDPRKPPPRTGVYVGGSNTEHMLAARTSPELAAALGTTQVRILTDREFLAPWISYRLGLTGPSIGVQTACSTSLTAVHLAAQALLLGECDTALAGGAALDAVGPRGYLYHPGGIYSPGGRCHPFDEKAAGTVPGNGVGLVVMRRLEDALADGDPIRAVIRGSAVTNDGAGKIGFTAPGIEGQTAAITEAWATAGLDPAQAQYLEAHGTGTDLGDRVEVAAAAAAFASAGKGQIVLGSVKANIGHLDTAAGVAALTKATLMLQQRTMLPQTGATHPHPALDLESTPFRLLNEATDWPAANGEPRRAGITAVGLGGTNVHIVLEEAPLPQDSAPLRRTALPARIFAGVPHGTLRPATSATPQPGGAGENKRPHQAQETAGGLEQSLAQLLIDSLGLNGTEDLNRTYFDVSGDSLTAVHLVSRISDEFGVNVPITRFLDEHPLHELISLIAAEAVEDPLSALIDEIEMEGPVKRDDT
ncbi:beta-ketoacyl synthase N-terminal-like domain-containing protein [Streptomyces sp. NPDC056337]|uniref:beta-ketoacyl synthase N-terminal-like domain-containing protein n=1 Tax=Streptomyces sp. NPDC056337 TaxID=3345787 RepID=UPI0035DC9D6D